MLAGWRERVSHSWQFRFWEKGPLPHEAPSRSVGSDSGRDLILMAKHVGQLALEAVAP